MAAIGMQLGGQNAGLVGGLQHHGACAVTEQHAGRAVVEIQDAAEDFGAHHQHALAAPVWIMESATVRA
jgi:hypothetical protein